MNFYSLQISSIKSDSIQEKIFLENVPKLTEEEKMSCEGLLTT